MPDLSILAQTTPSVGMEPLTWALITALLATIGTLLASLAKDFFFAKAIERFKGDQSFLLLFRKFKNPLVLAAIELAHRMDRILMLRQKEISWLDLDNTQSQCPRSQIAGEGQTFDRQYNQLSTVYRFIAFYGWLELFRREVAHVHSGSRQEMRAMRDQIELMNKALADQKWTSETNRGGQSDSPIFRDELRAIGESMLTSPEKGTVLGYDGFLVAFRDSNSRVHFWANEVFKLFLGIHQDDHRNCRYKRVLEFFIQLLGLIENLDPQQMTEDLRIDRTEALSRLRSFES